ncbi:hypothetical protein BDV40DRAFT_179905 [Aspergillus tamarii]|uniref:Uncharacterized protein n=1 Tax=Aspergillus tamarii TaxID=41984 RepID=A0A5N6USN2_ASPTM|nr:hypothetical protein BDV40DRAFT_179905 [Aspergillus tamarii]
MNGPYVGKTKCRLHPRDWRAPHSRGRDHGRKNGGPDLKDRTRKDSRMLGGRSVFLEASTKTLGVGRQWGCAWRRPKG